MRFAEKLKQLRTDAGVSERKLADVSGVSFGAIHNYGLGLRQPTFAAVVKIARALGVTCEAFADCDDVVSGDGERPDTIELTQTVQVEHVPAPAKRSRPRKEDKPGSKGKKKG